MISLFLAAMRIMRLFLSVFHHLIYLKLRPWETTKDESHKIIACLILNVGGMHELVVVLDVLKLN